MHEFGSEGRTLLRTIMVPNNLLYGGFRFWLFAFGRHFVAPSSDGGLHLARSSGWVSLQCKVNQCNSWFKKNEENKMSNAERILNTPASVVPSFIREELNGVQYTQVSTTREARSLLNAGGTTGRRTEDCPPRNSTAETW